MRRSKQATRVGRVNLMEHPHNKPHMDKPTVEQLLAEKAQLERRLFAINEQLLRIEADRRALILSKAVKIMTDYKLTINDVKSSRNGRR